MAGKGLARVNDTKTTAGKRAVALPAFAIAVLTERRPRPYVGEQSVIFPSTAGTLRRRRGGWAASDPTTSE